jgi:hypothetical protein
MAKIILLRCKLMRTDRCSPTLFLIKNSTWSYHTSCSYSPASHHEGQGSISSQSMWDLWWTKWHWDRSFLCMLRFFPDQCHSTSVLYSFIHHRRYIISVTDTFAKQHVYKGTLLQEEKRNCFRTEWDRKLNTWTIFEALRLVCSRKRTLFG